MRFVNVSKARKTNRTPSAVTFQVLFPYIIFVRFPSVLATRPAFISAFPLAPKRDPPDTTGSVQTCRKARVRSSSTTNGHRTDGKRRPTRNPVSSRGRLGLGRTCEKTTVNATWRPLVPVSRVHVYSRIRVFLSFNTYFSVVTYNNKVYNRVEE